MIKRVLFLLLVVAAPAFAENDKDITSPPAFGLMGSIGNNSTLAMTCYGEPPFNEIDCTFTQVLISAPSAKDVAAKKTEMAQELDQLTVKDLARVKEEWTPEAIKKIETRTKGGTPEQQAYTKDLTAIFRTLMAARDKTSLKDAIARQHDIEAATCSININSFDQHFSRISKNKWLHNPGATGLCNVVRVATLENQPDYPDLWTYTQSTVTADKDPTCQKWVEIGAIIVNSWDSPRGFKFEQCKYLQFGY